MPSSSASPTRRHRALVWSLIVIASVLLILSITANWVQREMLDTEQVVQTTDEIIRDQDVQAALSIYAVDQLYANVDVRGEIEQRLPGPAKALAAPAAAAARQFALDVEQKALASPQVQELLSSAVGLAHQQFVSLIRNESEYVSTTNGEVTLRYGPIVADLAVRLGVDPETIANVQGVVQDFSTDLKQDLTTAQTEIAAVRTLLSELQGGTVSPELQQELQALDARVAGAREKIASLKTGIKGARAKVPSPLQSRLATLDGRLSDLDGRLAALGDRAAAALEDPSQANVEALDAPLARLQTLVTDVLGLPVVQSPGELVLMSSTQLDEVETVLRALRSLGFALPLLAVLLYVVAIYLAKGWRRSALIAAGGGIVAATLLVLLARRLLGSTVVDSLASSETVEPAIRSVWEILSDGLRERALFILVIGLAFVTSGVLAGPSRGAVRVRRYLAPSLREQPVAVYSVLVVLFLLWLAFIPGIENLGQVLTIIALAILAVVGVEVLRRQAAKEFPPS